MAEEDAERTTRLLASFVDSIEAAGGVTWEAESFSYVPVGDPTWLDLAHLYLEACEALGREPKIELRQEDAEEEEDEDTEEEDEDGH